MNDVICAHQESDALSSEGNYEECVSIPNKIWTYFKVASIASGKEIEDLIVESLVKHVGDKSDRLISQFKDLFEE